MLNVICLKHGTKYSSDYVNRLYNMIERHLTVPHRFVCFTDDPTDLNTAIEIRMLPDNHLQGWWWKPYVFKKDHFPEGDTCFFIDLDMIIIRNIDHLISYRSGDFVGLRDPGRVFRRDYQKLGSAVMRWPAGKFSNIWDDFVVKFETICSRLHGDQDWIYDLHKNNIYFYPDEWIKSYKWEVRTRDEILGFGKNSKFKFVSNPKVLKETAVLAFHGYPMVHEVQDPIIVDNWR